jgi:hypothetical protein
MTDESRLAGTWHFLVEPPGNEALLHFTETGRAIQFTFGPNCARPRSPMRLWYSIESPGILRFRPKPEHEGWTRGYQFEGETLVLSLEEKNWICRKAQAHQIPDWFPRALETALEQ